MLTAKLQLAIDHCYSAIAEPETWPAAMHGLALASGADAACLYAEQAPELRLRLPASPAYQSFLEDFVDGGWWRGDHRAKRGWPRLRGGGKVLVEHDLVSEKERRALPVYNELYVKHDLCWWAAVSFRVDNQDWAMPLLRREASGPFDRETRHLLPVAKHLTRILGLTQKMTTTGAKDLVELLEANSRPALVVNQFGQCLSLNRLADVLIGDDLVLLKGRLHATDPASDKKLQGLIHTALCARSMTDVALPVMIRREGMLPLIVEAIAPLSSLASGTLNLHTALIITDLDQPSRPNPARLKDVFGFTPAEARLAEQLVNGETLSQASQRLHISMETARSQLKSMFVRTRTNRQTDLVRLLDRAAGGYRWQ